MEYIFKSFLKNVNKQKTNNHRPSNPRVKIRTFNIQKQKPSTSKSKNKNLQHPRTKVRTFNIQE
jgi:hypothetical protein